MAPAASASISTADKGLNARRRYRYPVGRQVFSEIIKGGFAYIDKTGYLYDLVHGDAKYIFLSRPRRFGKTLFISTLEAYFQGRYELFENLAITELEGHPWQTYPVVRFNLGSCKSVTVEGLTLNLASVLRDVEELYGRNTEEVTLSDRVKGVIRRAAAQAPSGEAVVLVDEYDAPLLNVVDNEEELAAFRQVMREFYAPLKDLDECLRFVFIAGITKFSQLSIFSELNNIKNISMKPHYAAICGITEEELHKSPDFDFAGFDDLTIDEAKTALKRAYDGYHFCGASPDIYNPFSLLQAFSDGQIESYWFSSGTPTALVKRIASTQLGIQDLQSIHAKEAEFDAPTESQVFLVPFMYQSGYLTIKGYDPVTRYYHLGIPNKEVEEGLVDALLPCYAGKEAPEVTPFVGDAIEALYYHHDLAALFRCLRSMLSARPSNLPYRDEHEFENVFYAFFAAIGFRLTCEQHFCRGTADVIIEVPGAVFVIELKYSKEGCEHTAAEALRQIHERGYLEPFEAAAEKRELELWAAGVVYAAEEGTLDPNWLIERIEG